jgi:hypothetical protein
MLEKVIITEESFYPLDYGWVMTLTWEPSPSKFERIRIWFERLADAKDWARQQYESPFRPEWMLICVDSLEANIGFELDEDLKLHAEVELMPFERSY